LLQAALTLRSQGRFEEALDLLSGPGDFPADVYTLRGDLLTELGRYADAAGSYYTATVSAPRNLSVRSRLASCLRLLGRWEDASQAFQAVLQADPHRDAIRLELGDCLLRLNRPEQALNCLDQCWSDAAQRQAIFGKGVALQQLRRFGEAEIAYQRVLALDGKAEEALANLIAMSMEVFDLERVQRYSRRLLEINPRSVPGLQGLTLVAVERGEMGAAARHFATLAEQAPEVLRSARSSDGPDAPHDIGASDEIIEYRVNRKALARMKELILGQPARPAARRY
jgi:tetratricopeptide (TPR) repeat protein